MTFRAWKYRDLLKISQLEKECFPKEPWSFQTLAQCFQSPAFYGVLGEENGEIVAYGGISVVCEYADVQNIAVSEPYRRCGAGGRILNALTDYAREKGAEKAFLEVRVSNSPAMALYIKNGFYGVHARTRYYSDGEDCLVMCKNLK